MSWCLFLLWNSSLQSIEIIGRMLMLSETRISWWIPCSLLFRTDYQWISLTSLIHSLPLPQCLNSSLGLSYLDSDKSHLNNIPDPGLDTVIPRWFFFLNSYLYSLKSLQQLAITYKLTSKLFSMATLKTLLCLPILSTLGSCLFSKYVLASSSI